jgi:hypothetical protein
MVRPNIYIIFIKFNLNQEIISSLLGDHSPSSLLVRVQLVVNNNVICYAYPHSITKKISDLITLLLFYCSVIESFHIIT